MENLEKLNKILLSNNVVEAFYNEMNNIDFAEWLNSILPELVDCANQQQDNPWHIYNCLEHILHSVEEINKQTGNLPEDQRRLLAYSMFYHDIGKPATYIRRFGKAYGREIDSFFGHNEKSAEIAKNTAHCFDFNQNETKLISKLVYDHDMFMFITEENDGNKFHKVLSKELVLDKIQDLNNFGNGKTLMKYLIMIGRADNKSQNPQMTQKALKLLDAMDSILNSLNQKEINAQQMQ